jgi:predicted nucleotidyltransferase
MASDLPDPVATLAADLAALPGAVAVALGGSRAVGANRADSDWDLFLYYRGARGALDVADMRRLGHRGHVSELGEWGPIVNGGAWLTLDGLDVDVLFRDLDVVEGWLEDARHGRFAVLDQGGSIAGAPTYSVAGELALCRPLTGEVPRPPGFPEALAGAAFARWRGRAGLDLMFASIHARAGDPACCAGMLARAVVGTAHARLAQRGEWALNEKRIVARAGLDAAQQLLARPGATRDELGATVAAVATVLGVQPLAVR